MAFFWPHAAFAAGAVLVAAGMIGIVLDAGSGWLVVLGAGLILVTWAASVANR